jgi:hypothetical protein
LDFDFKAYLSKESPYLTSQQINELIKDGFTIGGHSINHPLYKDLNIEDQILQTTSSVNELVNTFRLPYKVFSFPFTDNGVSEEFYHQVNPKLDLTFGTAGLKKDVGSKNLQRIGMEKDKCGKEIIKFQYMYYFFKALVGKNKIRR